MKFTHPLTRHETSASPYLEIQDTQASNFATSFLPYHVLFFCFQHSWIVICTKQHETHFKLYDISRIIIKTVQSKPLLLSSGIRYLFKGEFHVLQVMPCLRPLYSIEVFRPARTWLRISPIKGPGGCIIRPHWAGSGRAGVGQICSAVGFRARDSSSSCASLRFQCRSLRNTLLMLPSYSPLLLHRSLILLAVCLIVFAAAGFRLRLGNWPSAQSLMCAFF